MMRKTGFTLFAGVLFILFCLWISPLWAFQFNLNATIAKGDADNDKDWKVIDLSEYRLHENGVRSLYIELVFKAESGRVCLYNDTAYFRLRPLGEEINERRTAINFTDAPGEEDDSIVYYWIPTNASDKLEFRIDDIESDCNSELEYKVNVRGFN